MSSSIIRGKYLVARVRDDGASEIIRDGALYQENGEIKDVGPYSEVKSRRQPDEELGSDRHMVIPGLINAHHHIGLTPISAWRPRPGPRAMDHGSLCNKGHRPLPGHALLRYSDDRVGHHHRDAQSQY